MTILHRICHGDAHGNVVVSAGPEAADRDVEITITVPDAKPAPEMTPEQWRQFVRRTAGSIDDPTFCRHVVPKFENRLEFE